MEQTTLSSCSVTATCPPRPASPEQIISTRSIGTQEQPKTLCRATQTCAIKHVALSESSGQAGSYPRRQNRKEVSDMEDDGRDDYLWKDEENGRSQFKCSQCGDVFSSVEYLHKHDKKKHSQKTGRRYKCRFCVYSSNNGAHVKRHERTHTGEAPHVCEICSKGFTQKSNLEKHVNTLHKGERPYQCSTCGRTYKYKSNLEIHERVHTCERPYLCGKCGKAFTQKSHLSTHVRTHTGIKPYVCAWCERSFRYSSALIRHVIQVHTKE